MGLLLYQVSNVPWHLVFLGGRGGNTTKLITRFFLRRYENDTTISSYMKTMKPNRLIFTLEKAEDIRNVRREVLFGALKTKKDSEVLKQCGYAF